MELVIVEQQLNSLSQVGKRSLKQAFNKLVSAKLSGNFVAPGQQCNLDEQCCLECLCEEYELSFDLFSTLAHLYESLSDNIASCPTTLEQVSAQKALQLYLSDTPVLAVYDDGTEAYIEDISQFTDLSQFAIEDTKSKLVANVITQIKQDIERQDESALFELLSTSQTDALKGYLSE